VLNPLNVILLYMENSVNTPCIQININELLYVDVKKYTDNNIITKKSCEYMLLSANDN